MAMMMMSEHWLCDDCLMVACNGDTSGIKSEERTREVEDGVASLGPHLSANFDADSGDGIEEFDRSPCDACGTHLAGSRHRFAILAPCLPKCSVYGDTLLYLTPKGHSPADGLGVTRPHGPNSEHVLCNECATREGLIVEHGHVTYATERLECDECGEAIVAGDDDDDDDDDTSDEG